eukprot:IDg21064t1
MMAQRAVPDMCAAADTAGIALARLARAAGGAAAAARSGALATARGRAVLGGVRIVRAEALLSVARDELRAACSALDRVATRAEKDEDEVAPLAWHTPSASWWQARRDELAAAAKTTLVRCEETEHMWHSVAEGLHYADRVRAMAIDVAEINKKWQAVLGESAHWRAVVATVADGLPSSVALT